MRRGIGRGALLWGALLWGGVRGDSPASLDALPGGRELNQDSILAHAGLLVQGDQLEGTGHHRVPIKRQPGVGFSEKRNRGWRLQQGES